MLTFIKKYWDILSGAAAGILLSVIAEFELESVQLYYSIIILILVCIGVFRILRQAVVKHKNERKHNIIDSIVDSQKSIKAISLSQAPTEEGEKIGKIIIILWGVTKTTMEKIKTFFKKFKGYMLTIALAILTIIEMCGAPINSLCGGALTINGIEIIPVVTLVCTTVVGIISNGYTKEQIETIKTVISTPKTNTLVKDEIKKTLKDNTAKLAQANKDLTAKKRELVKIEGELETLKNKYEATNVMRRMTPPLATDADVQTAANTVVNHQAKVADLKNEITKIEATIKNLNTIISALKSQI